MRLTLFLTCFVFASYAQSSQSTCALSVLLTDSLGRPVSLPVVVSRDGSRLAMNFPRTSQVVSFCNLSPGLVDISVSEGDCGVLEYRGISIAPAHNRFVHLSYDSCKIKEDNVPPLVTCEKRLRLLDSGEAPVSGASLMSFGFPRLVRSDANGYAVIRFPDRQSYMVQIDHPRFATKTVTVLCQHGVAEADYVISLDLRGKTPSGAK